jgi:vacuolar protein sorting-associated protein 54
MTYPVTPRILDALWTANQQALGAVLPEVLPAATELANTRLSKVVVVRSEQHASLALSEFLVLFNEGWAFVVKCEIMARKMIVGLRGVMVSQVC